MPRKFSMIFFLILLMVLSFVFFRQNVLFAKQEKNRIKIKDKTVKFVPDEVDITAELSDDLFSDFLNVIDEDVELLIDETLVDDVDISKENIPALTPSEIKSDLLDRDKMLTFDGEIPKSN